MIEINLLPKDMQKKKGMELPAVSFLPILAGVVGVIILVHLLFSLSANLKTRTLRRLENKWEEIAPAKKDADEVIAELTGMRGRIDAIDELIQGRTSWAKKLNDLCDAMTAGVWLNRLWIERNVLYRERQPKKGKQSGKVSAGPQKVIVKTLHLNGSVIVTGGEETAAVGKFMFSLENNQGFFADFDRIESAYMQHARQKDVEVMDFELVCDFK